MGFLTKASIASYAGCAAFTLLDKPPLLGVSKEGQLILYTACGTVLAIAELTKNKGLQNILGLLYGVGAMAAFNGVAQWNWTPTNVPEPVLGVAMAGWDLALAYELLKEAAA
jgi:hypothetical protein